MISDPGYSHTQKGPLCLFLYGIALYCFTFALLIGHSPGNIILFAIGLLIILLGPAFHHLTVRDEGEVLGIRFGPLPLFHKTIAYADMERVEVGRTLIIEAWGIHYSIFRGGWVWNLWGRNCVVVHRRKGSVLRIGTDDAENLARFLETKMVK